MADQGKSFRTRRLAFGARMVLCLLAAAVVAGAARAQDAGLKSGAASIAAGKYSDAVRQLSATINSEAASPGEAAKALYLRGIAYRKLNEPARAAADLGAAVWLGLPEPDRVKALVNRGLAYRAAGLSNEAEAELASARKVGGSSEVDKLIAEGGAIESAASLAAFSTEVRPGDQATASNEGSSWFSLSRFRNRSGTPAPAAPQPEAAPTRTASASPQWTTTTSKPGEETKPSDAEAPGAWSTSVANADPPSNTTSATRNGNRFTRWFGSVSESAPAPAPEPTPATQTAAATPQPSKSPSAAASSSWSTTTEDASAAGGSEKKSSWRLFGRTAEAEPAAEPAAQAPASGGYKLQLANSRSEGEANSLWKKISQSEGLSGVSHEIEKIEIGNFGTFYSLKIGPFPDKAQSVKVCNALKRNGIDCLPATL